MHYIYIKETFEIPLCQCFTFAKKETLFIFNPIETLPIVCNMHPVECNVRPVKCSIYHVESSIDVGHLKFPLGLILTTILTPKVENEVLTETNGRQVGYWQRLMKGK